MKVEITDEYFQIHGDGWVLEIFDKSNVWTKPVNADKVVSILKGGNGGAPGEPGHPGVAVIFTTTREEGSAQGGLTVTELDRVFSILSIPVQISHGGSSVKLVY